METVVADCGCTGICSTVARRTHAGWRCWGENRRAISERPKAIWGSCERLDKKVYQRIGSLSFFLFFSWAEVSLYSSVMAMQQDLGFSSRIIPAYLLSVFMQTWILSPGELGVQEMTVTHLLHASQGGSIIFTAFEFNLGYHRVLGGCILCLQLSYLSDKFFLRKFVIRILPKTYFTPQALSRSISIYIWFILPNLDETQKPYNHVEESQARYVLKIRQKGFWLAVAGIRPSLKAIDRTPIRLHSKGRTAWSRFWL